MAIIAPQGATRERLLKVQITLSRMLGPSESLRLLNDGVSIGELAQIDDYTYEADYAFDGEGDPATTLRFIAQALYDGQAIANSPLYEISFYDPPRAEIRAIEYTPSDIEDPNFYLLSEDGFALLDEDGFALLSEDQV